MKSPSKMKKLPAYLCKECADTFKKKPRMFNHIASVHIGTCPLCKKEKELASAADYGIKEVIYD